MKEKDMISGNCKIRKLNWLIPGSPLSRGKQLWVIVICAMFMSGCASVSPVALPDNFYDCPEPEEYPENPTLFDLIYSLNDTYLAWEACRQAFQHKFDKSY